MGDGGSRWRLDHILEELSADLRERVYRPTLRSLQDVEGDLIRSHSERITGEVDASESERLARQFATNLRRVYAARAALEDQLLGARDVILARMRKEDPK
jgi:hypothetical protein